jgi:hypothetical protein
LLTTYTSLLLGYSTVESQCKLNLRIEEIYTELVNRGRTLMLKHISLY